MASTHSNETVKRRQEIRKLYLEQHLTPKQISQAMGLPLDTVYQDITALREQMVQSTDAKPGEKEERRQISGPMSEYILRSIEDRKWLLQKCKEIIQQPPRKIRKRTKDGIVEFEYDDLTVKIMAIRTFNQVQNSLDKFLGIMGNTATNGRP